PQSVLCQNCPTENFAIWRCRDCMSPPPLCRGCMRRTHLANPLHRLECWNGHYYRNANLWEVGASSFSISSVLPIATSVVVSETNVNIPPAPSGTPVTLPFPNIPIGNVPRTDAMRNRYVCVVHTNGVHDICLVYCTCQGIDEANADLLHSRLLPTSFTQYSTLFTTFVLDDFRLANLECKASAYQYFQTLRRKSNPTNPAGVPDRYRELRRLSREWRAMKKWKWGGLAHTGADISTPAAGALTLFCPACPQPTVNLPANWRDDENQTIYMRTYVADGNFKADHIAIKGAGNDIWLSEGGGMMPKRAEYDDFLRKATERITKAPCQNLFRVIELAMMLLRACDINGVVCIACARHGCYAPNSLVNLFRGEQQKNVDFAFLSALRTTHTEGIERVLLLYDIACQYSVHFLDRIGPMLPEGMTVDHGIGMFHVHGHQEECFYRFAPSFIPGAGNVAGEILESLWSELNQISSSTRSMTLAARAETLEDHTSDSNFKKTIGMATALCATYAKAQKNKKKALEYYDKLVSSVEPALVVEWDDQIEHAELQRTQKPSVMDVLKAKSRKSNDVGPTLPDLASKDDIQQWFEVALQLEEKQANVRYRVRVLRDQPTDHAIEKVQSLRQELVSQFGLLDSLQKKLGVFPEAVRHSDTDIETAGVPDSEFMDDDTLTPAEHQREPPMEQNQTNPGFCPELRPISFPTNCDTDGSFAQSMRQFRPQELYYRIQRASQLLVMVREAVAAKSFQFSHVKRKAPTKGAVTRSMATVNKKTQHIMGLSRLYRQNREKLVLLGADERTLTKFKALSPEDVKASRALLRPNEPGSKDVVLPWIWHVNDVVDNSPAGLIEFQRVHYLRARANKLRWEEEYTLAGYEMEWTSRFYLHQSAAWEKHAGAAAQECLAGAKSYALRKKGMWKEINGLAEKRFRKVNLNYTSPWPASQ
ncbi:hypothetical protein BDN70DRAFT_820446, partial [Pholiota conissans]